MPICFVTLGSTSPQGQPPSHHNLGHTQVPSKKRLRQLDMSVEMQLAHHVKPRQHAVDVKDQIARQVCPATPSWNSRSVDDGYPKHVSDLAPPMTMASVY